MRKCKPSPAGWLLKRHLYLALIVFLIVFFVVDFTGILRIAFVREGIRSLDGYASNEQVLKDYTRILSSESWYRFRVMNAETVFGCFGAIGFCTALLLFRHHFSRKESMRIAALPITREKDFLLRVLCFVTLVLLPVLICFALYPLMVYGNGLGFLFDLKIYLLKVAGAILTVMYGFSVGALAVSVCGTLPMAVLMGILLVGTGELLYFIGVSKAGCYLITLSESICTKWMMSVSPFVSLYKFLYDPTSFGALPGIIAILVFFPIAFLVYRIRKPENAGSSLCLHQLDLPVWIAISLLGGAMGGMVFLLILGEPLPLYVATILGAFMAGILGRILLDLHTRNIFRRLWIPGSCAAVWILALLCMRMDVIGFDGFAPAQEEITTIRVDTGSWRSMDVMTFETDEQAKEACVEWVGLLREERLEEKQKNGFQRAWNDNVTVEFVRNGKSAVRIFNQPGRQEEAIPYLNTMLTSAEYRDSISIPVRDRISINVCLPTFSKYGTVFEESFGFSLSQSSTDRNNPSKVGKIREALLADMRERTFEDLQQPVVLQISFYGPDPETGLYTDDDYNSYSVYTTDDRTLTEILGEEKQKWIDYANGAYMDSDDLVAMDRIYDTETGKILSNTVLTKEDFANMKSKIVHNTDSLFGLPFDRNHLIAIYSRRNVMDYLEWGDSENVDLDNPETWNVSGIGYTVMYLKP